MIDDEFALLRSTFTIILAHSRIDNRQRQSNSILSTISSTSKYSIVLLQQLNLMIFEGGRQELSPLQK